MSFREQNKLTLAQAIESANTGLDAIKRAPIVSYNSGTKCLRIQDVSQSKELEDWGFCEVETKNLDKFCLKRGDIMVARTGATIGVNLLIREDLKAVYNNGLIRLKINNQIAYYKYIYYNLRSSNYWGHIESISGGTSTQPNMRINALLDYNIIIPTIPEQKAIANILSVLDDKIDINNRINKNLEEMAQCIFKSWFVDFEPFQDGEFEDSELGRIPKGWRVEILKDIVKFIKGKKPKELLDIKNSHSQVQYLTIDVLSGGNAQFAEIDKMVLANKYDNLMVMDGASSGTVYFGMDGIIGSTIGKLEVNNEQVREIIYQYLKVNEAEIKSHNTGSAIPHTDKGYLLRCKLAIPTEKELSKIASNLRKIREKIIMNKIEKQNLIIIRDSLLPKLMSGEIRVPIKEAI